jgi:uncharacterized repeat protein (TIGR02543 family)
LSAIAQGSVAAGSGVFQQHPITPGFGSAGRVVRLADINADGRLDAVVSGDSTTTLWLNDGSGNFSSHPSAPAGLPAGGTVALGDLNGDGRIDIVVSGKVFMGTVSGWSAHGTTPSFGSGGYVALGDLDGDGDLDAVMNGGVWLNNGTGAFSAHPTTPVFSADAFTSVSLGDLDGDGDLDLVATGDQRVFVYVNNASGSLTPHPTVPTVGSLTANKSMQHAALADLDGDGDLDVLAVLTDTAGGPSSNLVLRNGGSGNLSQAGSFAGNTRVALADVDGDGDPDALTDTTTGVWRNAGTATFSAHPSATNFAGVVTSFAAGDVDGDGDLDVLASHNPGSTEVWLNVNAGSFGITATASPQAGGSVTCTPNPVSSGGSSTCTATANTGHTFAGWSGHCSGTANPCTLTNITSARTVTATFTANTYAITTAVNPSGSGTVSCSSNPVSHGGSSTCTATANAGFTFTGWSGDCSGVSCTLSNVTSPRSVTASFAASTYPITTAASPAGGGVVSCSPNPVAHGGSTTCTASANPGYAFSAWSGACSGTTCTIANVTSARSVTASFVAVSPSGPPRLGNISTRGLTLTGDNVLIGGFIIGGSTSKTVIIRARGPSLSQFGVASVLANPQIQLFTSDHQQIASNNDWQQASNASVIAASGFAPTHASEAAILTALPPGRYTAIVTGVAESTGVAIVEVFEVGEVETPLVNISTRGFVQTGDDVLIGGIIVQGSGPQKVVVRARGPSLAQFGVPNLLANPQLQLFNAQHQQIAFNDNWQQASNVAEIQAGGQAPPDANESAILVTLDPGAYTAIVTGVGATTGVAIVEVFAVP